MGSINYLIHNGKNPKWLYFAKSYARKLIPSALFRRRLEDKLAQAKLRSDYAYIQERVNYYCKLNAITKLPANTPMVAEAINVRPKVYHFDTVEYTRWFNPRLKLSLLPGDNTKQPSIPSLLKSRPIQGDSRNAVLLNLNKLRHFIFLNDKIAFSDKEDKAVFRGKVKGKPMRREFMQKFFGNPKFDIGDVSKKTNDPVEWRTEKLTLNDHLRFKFVMALEGNDVASNLKWVMSSNSIAVTPPMKFETWFMEGKLIPNYHYIEVKEDFSDLEEKLNYYATHTEEAQQIIDHAHEFVQQFKDKEREEIIALMVTKKYFEMTGQL